MQLHSGSRGLGYQVCDDNLKLLVRWAARERIALPDRQLVYAPLNSPQGRAYLAGMKAAANFAFANRQIMTHLARRTFEETLSISPKSLNMRLVIDVCHNIAKMEEHLVEGRPRLLCVHRKGATRAFSAGRPELPRRIPDDRPAGPDPRRHGPGLVPAPGPARGHGPRPSAPPATARVET